MGNLVCTPSELDPLDELSADSSPRMRKQLHTPSLGLVSKPLVVAEPVPDESLWTRLFSNLRDAFFPRKLPPLELVSQPIAVADPMAVKRDPLSSAISFILHAGVFALILWFAFQVHKQIVAPPQVVTVPIYVKPFIPVTAPAPKTMGGGGGGGEHQVVEASKGHLPPVAKVQIVPVETLQVDHHPKLAVAPTVMMPAPVKIPINNHLPNFGMPTSPQVAMVSQGSGGGGGFGQAGGGGIGVGHGAGVGPGTVGGYGGGIMTVGGGVTAPQLIHSVKPEFSDAATRAKYEGVVSIQLIVDPQGNPQNVHVVKHLGMGLDEKAIEAVQQYKFRPAMYQGHPVPVQMVIDVNFQLD
jgi:protein TonB